MFQLVQQGQTALSSLCNALINNNLLYSPSIYSLLERMVIISLRLPHMTKKTALLQSFFVHGRDGAMSSQQTRHASRGRRNFRATGEEIICDHRIDSHKDTLLHRPPNLIR